MGRFSFNPSSAALALAATALFVALGGPAWAAGLIGTSQIRNGAITSKKIGHRQVKSININRGGVKTVNLSNGAVTADKVKTGSLTAADVAPGVFLGADAQAQDSKDLGGKPATDYLTGSAGLPGSSGMVDNQLSVPAGQTLQLLNLGIGLVNASCNATGVATLSFVSEEPSIDLVDTVNTAATVTGISNVDTVNGLATGATHAEPNPTNAAQSVTFQAAFEVNGTDHVATAWTSGQSTGSTGCLFIGQALTTG